MKTINKIILSIILSTTLGCSITGLRVPKYEWFKINTPEKIPAYATNEKGIYDFVSSGIRYQENNGGRCFLPQETLDKEYGDCDDKAVLAIAIYNLKYEKKGSILIGNAEGGNDNHAEPNFCGETFYDKNWFTPIREYQWKDMPYFPWFFEE